MLVRLLIKQLQKNIALVKRLKDNGYHELLVRTVYTNYNIVQTVYIHLYGQKYKTST